MIFYHFRGITQMMERFKICWYVLTKNHYAFFAYDREVLGRSGAKCYIENEAEKSKVFVYALKDFSEKLDNKLNSKKHNNEKQKQD